MNQSNTCTCGHDQEFHQWGSHNEKCDCRAFTPTADSTDELEQLIEAICRSERFQARVNEANRNGGGVLVMEQGTYYPPSEDLRQLQAIIAAHDRRRDEEHRDRLLAAVNPDGVRKAKAANNYERGFDHGYDNHLEQTIAAIRAEFADTEDTK